jgi:histidinol-phosphate aminotransferase
MNGTKRWLVEELHKEGRRIMPSETNFVMIDVGRDVGPLGEVFKAKGLRVGRRFPALPQWLRISIGTDAETRAFLAALREIVPARPA